MRQMERCDGPYCFPRLQCSRVYQLQPQLVLCMGYSWVEVVVMGMSIIASPGFIRGRTCGGAVITCSKTDGTQS